MKGKGEEMFEYFNFLESVYFYFVFIAFFVYHMILLLKKEFSLKEWLVMNLLAAITMVAPFIDRSMIPFADQLLNPVTMISFPTFYLYKMFRVNVRSSIILAVFGSFIFSFIEGICRLVTYILFGTHTWLGGWNISVLLVNVLLIYIFAGITALLLRKPCAKIFSKLNRNKQLEKLLSNFTILLFFVLLFFMNYIYIVGYVRQSPLVVVSFFIIVIAATTSFIIYTLYVEARQERLQKELEGNHLEYYTNELEQQQISIRKFRHDYQNIFLSIKSYIDDGDLQGLKKYYGDNITTASKAIVENDFTLDSLQKIKVREIKSILASKIIATQNLGGGAKVVVEVNEEIEKIPVESITLVRMLGIILDNAIEAISERDFEGDGLLYVGVFKWSSGITIIVENTCGQGVPPLEQLWKSGFTTKGKGHGLGLGNLLELANQSPNVTLGTSVEDGKFRQELLIENLE